MTERKGSLKLNPDEYESDRLVKATCAVWNKIQDLKKHERREQKDAVTSPNYSYDEEEVAESECGDETCHDIKYQLLKLQLRYCRHLLHQKFPQKNKNVGTNTDEILFAPYKSSHSSSIDDDLDQIPVKLQHVDKDVLKKLSPKKYTSSVVSDKAQTEILHSNTFKSVPATKDKKDLHVHVKESDKDKQIVPKPDSEIQSKNQPTRTILRHTRPILRHPRPISAEVPFLLGSSTFPSHSVVAGVQTIISTMKHHNVASLYPSKTGGAPKFDKNYVLKFLSKDYDELLQKRDELRELSNNYPKNNEIQQQYKDVRENLEEKARHIIEWNAKLHSGEATDPKLQSNLPRWKSSGNVRICN